MSDLRFEFPAVRGEQGGRIFYSACVPFNALARLLAIDTGNVLDRSQRVVDAKRASAISDYICKNVTGFVLPGLTGVVEDETLEFKAAVKNGVVGMLSLSMDAIVKLFDGQHRATGILDAVKNNKAQLKNHQASIQLFVGMSLAERQQAFSDINSNAKAVSASLNLAYDKRNYMAQQFYDLIDMVESWSGAIDFENNIVKQTSDKLFSFRHVVEANRILLGLNKTDEPNELHLKTAANWWNSIAKAVGWFIDAERRSEKRGQLVTLNAVGLMVLARVGEYALRHQLDIQTITLAIKEMNFERERVIWEGNIVGKDGNLVTKTAAQIDATASVLATLLRISGIDHHLERFSADPADFYNELGVPEEQRVQTESLHPEGWHMQQPGVWFENEYAIHCHQIKVAEAKTGQKRNKLVLSGPALVGTLEKRRPELGEFYSWDAAIAAAEENNSKYSQ
ncbi:DNA sulfur modification protein DndB [Rheinheimera pacifica]|uniref:DNA sulfur modification protein DndB n=1 Tax=Rheinheimera pacifica TaxID=173990 RepID=UPI00216803E1|nr:DNA sulfur modification protein DndB [Rheinheimera pacifica]MCS4309465.1 DNA sulfur modification protein DndB [Rheinheimera pacifica]